MNRRFWVHPRLDQSGFTEPNLPQPPPFLFSCSSTQGQLPACCKILFGSPARLRFTPLYSHFIRTDCCPFHTCHKKITTRSSMEGSHFSAHGSLWSNFTKPFRRQKTFHVVWLFLHSTLSALIVLMFGGLLRAVEALTMQFWLVEPLEGGANVFCVCPTRRRKLSGTD